MHIRGKKILFLQFCETNYEVEIIVTSNFKLNTH